MISLIRNCLSRLSSLSPLSRNSMQTEIVLNKICNIERTISTLQNEVKELKNYLKRFSESHTTNDLKKRKLCDQVDQTLLTNNENFVVDNEGYVHVYTDGACENNGKKNAKAGLGVWFGSNHPLNVAEPVKRRPTNNVGEIEACIRAIELAHESGIQNLCINTDSEFTINCITKWINGWKKNGWRTASGNSVINKDELIELDNKIKLLEHVKFNHVRGHQGIIGNEKADELARKGALMYKE